MTLIAPFVDPFHLPIEFITEVFERLLEMGVLFHCTAISQKEDKDKCLVFFRDKQRIVLVCYGKTKRFMS